MSDLHVAWSGSLERAGQAPGLSRYQGPSPLAASMLNEDRPPHGWRQEPGTRVKRGSLDTPVKALLAKGWSPERISQHLGCSPGIARRVRRRLRGY